MLIDNKMADTFHQIIVSVSFTTLQISTKNSADVKFPRSIDGNADVKFPRSIDGNADVEFPCSILRHQCHPYVNISRTLHLYSMLSEMGSAVRTLLR